MFYLFQWFFLHSQSVARSLADPDPRSGAFLTPKIAIYLFLCLHKGRPIYKSSAFKREHPALLKLKILTFFHFYVSLLPSWIRIRILDPDTDQEALGIRIPIWIHNIAMQNITSELTISFFI